MLDDLRAGGGRDDGRHGRHVDRVGTVAAGAHDVHGLAIEGDRSRVIQHRLRERRELADGLALGAQADDESRDLYGGGLTREDLVHRPADVGRLEILASDERGEDLAPGRHGHALAATPAWRSRSATTCGSFTGSIG